MTSSDTITQTQGFFDIITPFLQTESVYLTCQSEVRISNPQKQRGRKSPMEGPNPAIRNLYPATRTPQLASCIPLPCLPIKLTKFPLSLYHIELIREGRFECRISRFLRLQIFDRIPSTLNPKPCTFEPFFLNL
jgi:hypothetical protein